MKKKKDFNKFTKRNTHKRRSKEAAKRELMKAVREINVGFDGVKILDGKPKMRKNLGRRLDDPIFDPLYAFLQEHDIPVTMHLGDPPEFWDINKISEYALKVGWYCDETYPTLEEMRLKLGQSLQSYSDERGEMDLQDRLLRQAAETLDFTASEAEIEEAVEQQLQTLSAQLSQRGLTLDMYCGFLNTDPDTVRADLRPAAEAALRSAAAIDEIVRLEGLEAEPQEIAEALAVICRQNNMTMEQIKPYYNAELEQAVIHSVLTGKVMRLIRDAADVTVV